MFLNAGRCNFEWICLHFKAIFRWLIYIGAVLVILIFGLYGPRYDAASFIYKGF